MYTDEQVKKRAREYFEGDELATDVWLNKYAVRNEEGKFVESTPTDMHYRLAKEFARIEKKFERDLSDRELNQLSSYGRNRRLIKTSEIFDLLDKFENIIPQGSIMSILGNNFVHGSLSNCVVAPSPYDSYGGIMYTDQQLAQLYKRRAGVGINISTLRPKGASVTNVAKTSSGAVSFMHRFSHTTREVAQNGRRGALMVMMDCRHPDIEDFITVKEDLTKVTGANISVLWHDDFMEAVDNNEEYTLRWPIDADPEEAEYTRVVKAKDVWDLAVKAAHQSAEPGCAFIDRIKDYSLGDYYPEFEIIASNPCQPNFATVLTPTGIKTFADIDVGSIIWSGEEWTKVTNKWTTGIKDVYKYNTTFGSFIGTENHIVISNGERVEIKDAETVDAKAGEIFDEAIHFPQIIMDGLVLGDGSVHKASNNLVFLYVGQDDHDYFDSEIADYILKDRTQAFATSETTTAFEVQTTITAEELPYTYERTVPDRYFYGDRNVVISFLRGLFSANGSVVANGRRVTLKQSSKILINQVQEMLSAVGVRSYITINKPTTIEFSNGVYDTKESYDLNITQDRYIFRELIGFLQEYKNQKIAGEISYRLSSGVVKEVECLGKHRVYDITVESEDHTYWTGGLNVSNCSEIFMNNDSCRLMVVNMFHAVNNPYTEEAKFDFEKFYESVYEAQRLMDDVVELELESIEKLLSKVESDPEPDHVKRVEIETWKSLYESGKRGRRTGLGFTALGDTLAALDIKYDSKKALELFDKIMRTKLKAEFDSSVDMAIERGAFPAFDADVEVKSDFNDMIRENFPDLFNRMLTHGRRNISISTVAPTGSVSILAKLENLHGTTGGIEPVYSLWFTRRRKVDEGDDFDFKDDLGDRWKNYKVFHAGFKEWAQINNISLDVDEEELEEIVKRSPYYQATAEELNWETRVEMQAVGQKYTTHSISSTVNLPSDANEKDVDRIYRYAHKQGLKGITVYVDGSRTGVLVKEEKNQNGIVFTNAPKRPEELSCKITPVRVNGDRWLVLIGFLDSDPYEVFAFKSNLEVEGNGRLLKLGGGVYNLLDEDGEVLLEDVVNSYDSDEEQALTRTISLSLRHGAEPKYVLEQLNKAQGTVVSFSKAIYRALAEYAEYSGDECPECSSELVFSQGCASCPACGYEKCG